MKVKLGPAPILPFRRLLWARTQTRQLTTEGPTEKYPLLEGNINLQDPIFIVKEQSPYFAIISNFRKITMPWQF